MDELDRRTCVEHIVRKYLVSDLAESVIESEALGALAYNLDNSSGGDEDEIDTLFLDLINRLDERTMEWLEDTADDPAAFLASRVK